MRYAIIGGPLNGRTLSWRAAKAIKRAGVSLIGMDGRAGRYRGPTLGESVAWDWPSVVVWEAA